MQILSNLSLYGTLGLNSVADANTDTDKFLVIDSNGIVKYRTGAELYSDIGAGGAAAYTSVLQHTVKAGVALTKGQAVYVTSADGTNMIVGKASNASEATSSKTLGLIAQDLALNGQGFVITEGLLAGLDTSTAAAGDPVWLGTDGNLIYGLLNKPYAPEHLVFIGIVTRAQQNNGEIFVKVQNGFEINELHNVQISSTPSDNSVLSYETSTSLYKMKPISTLLGYTPANSTRTLTINGTAYDLSIDRTWNVGTTTGSGASGQVAYWNGITSQTGSSSFFWDATNNRLGVGLNNPQRKVEIYSAIADSHLRISGSAPSVSLGEAITGSIYQAKFGLATASGQYSSSAAAGDFVIISQTGATIWMTGTTDRLRLNYSGNFSIGNTNDTYKLDVTGTGRFAGNLIVSDGGYIQVNGSSNGYLNLNAANAGGNEAGIFYQIGGSNKWENYTAANDSALNWYSYGSSSIVFKLASTGAATFSSSVTAGGNFTTTADGGAGGLRLTLNNTGLNQIQYAILSGGVAGDGNFALRNGSVGSNLLIITQTGAATFSNTVTATEFILNNGSADGGQLVLASSGYSNWNIDNYSGSLRAYYGSTEFIRLMNNGQLRLNTYTSSSAWTGTAVATLGVDSSGNVITITGGSGGVTSFNTRTGAVTLSSSDVTTALGYTPYNSTNPNGYITGITSGMVTTALGYTPYNSSNPSGYITSSALSSYLPLSGGTMSGDITLAGYRVKDLTSTNRGVFIGNWGGAGYWGLGSTSNAHELKLDQVGPSTGFWEGATDVNLYLGSNRLVLHSANYSSYALPLSGGTMSGVITTVSSGTAINFSGQSDSFGYNASSGLGTYIKGTGSTYIYGGGIFYDGSSQRTLLHSGNYNSYSPTLTGGGASGTWGISITGNAATVGGYAPSASTGANTVVIRDVNNYIYAYYINSSVSETENPTINSFFTSNGDGWLRKSSMAHVKSQLGLGSNAYTSTSYVPTAGGVNMTGKLGIMNGTNGAGDRGIAMWQISDTNWGIYMTQAGAGLSFSNGTASSSLDGRTSHAIRFRVNNSSSNYFQWENSSEQALMSLTADYGDLYTNRTIYAGGDLVTTNVVYPGYNNGAAGTQTSYYIYGNSANSGLRTNGAWLVNGNIYWGNQGVWLTDWLNQSVKTNASVTFYSVSSTNFSVGNAIYFGGGNNYFNWDGSRINSNVGIQSGTDMRAPQFRFTNSSNNAYLTGNSDWGFRVVNDSGYIQFGPANGSWSHIYSDKSFYFNQELYINNVQVVKNSGTWSINITGGAGSANLASQVSVNYNNDSNSTYQLLWGSGNSVYGTAGVYVNPYTDIVYATEFSSVNGISVYTSSGSAYLRLTDNQVYRPAGGGLYLNWSSSGDVYLTGTGGGRVGVGNNSPAYKMHVSGDIYADGGWVRVSGSTGIYFESYGGGWRMTGSSYIEAYNGKSLHMGGASVDYVGSLYFSGAGHIQPNAGSYGALQMTSSKNGWAGIRFVDSDNNLMMNSNESGHHRNGYGWQFRWSNGSFYISTNSYGGGAEYTALHSGNYSGTLDSRYFYNRGFGAGYPSENADTMPENCSAFTYSNNAPLTGAIAHFGASGYGIQLNGNYNGDSFSMRSRNGDAGSWRPWKRLITDSNYTDYTFQRNAWNGNIYINTDGRIYGTIFYDSNNDGYYVDPSGTSNLYKFSSQTMGFNGMNPMSANSPYVDRYNGSGNYRNGTMGYGNTDFNTIFSNWGSGFIDTWSSPANAPGGSTHYVGLQGFHYNHQNGSQAYGFQMAMAGESDNRFFWRSAWPNLRSWVEMLHTGNASYAYNMNQNVRTSDSPTFNYVYASYSTRIGEIWGGGGLYRSSGAMYFGTEGAGWTFRSGNIEKAYIATDGNLWMSWSGEYLSTTLDRKAVHRGEGTNYVDYSRYVYNNNAYSGSGWVEPSDLGVRYASSSGSSDRLYPFGAAIDNTHPGYGLRAWYDWAYSGTYRNGISLGSNPGDQSYGWQLWQNMWDDRTYTRRYNGGWQTTRTLLTAQDDPYAYNMNQYVRTSDGVTFGSVTSNGLIRVNGNTNLYLDYNYGCSVVGVYSSYRYQGIFAMGDGYKLAIDGTSPGNLYGLAWSHPNTGGQAGYLDSHGLLVMVNGVTYSAISNSIWARGDVTAYSDARVKTNVEIIENALEKIKSIRGVTFNRTDLDHDTARHAGVIAQEVLKVLPEVVTTTKDGMHSVAYGNMAALFIEAIKEQQKQIEYLKSKLDGITK